MSGMPSSNFAIHHGNPFKRTAMNAIGTAG
jgi:hypothetical protein